MHTDLYVMEPFRRCPPDLKRLANPIEYYLEATIDPAQDHEGAVAGWTAGKLTGPT
jgi:hypothetical protein